MLKCVEGSENEIWKKMRNTVRWRAHWYRLNKLNKLWTLVSLQGGSESTLAAYAYILFFQSLTHKMVANFLAHVLLFFYIYVYAWSFYKFGKLAVQDPPCRVNFQALQIERKK